MAPVAGSPYGPRRLPRWSEVKPLLRIRQPFGLHSRVDDAASIGELRQVAKRRTPRAVFDYVDGAADSELSARRNTSAFARAEFLPRVLRDVSTVDPSTEILGRRAALPLVFGPTGFTRMMHHEGEIAVARVAERVGIPYTLATMGTTSPDDLAAAAPGARRWFQLYLWRDRAMSKEFVDRAAAAGFDVLVLTVDTPVSGVRLRDVRNGLTIPPALTLRTLAGMVRHPSWWLNVLTTAPLEFAALHSTEGSLVDLGDRILDPTIGIADLEWLRSIWPGKLVVKGVQDPADARAVVGAGADAVVVSNHGGRQLDRAAIPLESLPGIREAIGDGAGVYLDGGIRSGSDIVAAVGLGADACLIGRAWLYGLMAGGERGVQRAVELLSEQITRTMALIGAASLREVDGHRVRLRPA